MRHRRSAIGMALLVLSLAGPCLAQDIEPRRWTLLPVGMNVPGAGVIRTDGDIALDPVLEEVQRQARLCRQSQPGRCR